MKKLVLVAGVAAVVAVGTVVYLMDVCECQGKVKTLCNKCKSKMKSRDCRCFED